MLFKQNEFQQISLLRTFVLLGDTPTLKILYALERQGEKSFTELKEQLDINPATLSNRLKRLTLSGIVAADRMHDRLHVYYSVDKKAKSLRRVLDAMERFAGDLD